MTARAFRSRRQPCSRLAAVSLLALVWLLCPLNTTQARDGAAPGDHGCCSADPADTVAAPACCAQQAIEIVDIGESSARTAAIAVTLQWPTYEDVIGVSFTASVLRHFTPPPPFVLRI